MLSTPPTRPNTLNRDPIQPHDPQIPERRSRSRVHHEPHGRLLVRTRPRAGPTIAKVPESAGNTAERRAYPVIAEAPAHREHQHVIRSRRLHTRGLTQRL